MLKKLTAVSLLLAFSQAYAAAPLNSDLNKSFDELNYKLNVEWNQTDSNFYNETIKKFEKEIEGLRARGLRSLDLIKYSTDKIKDHNAQKEFNEISKFINESGMSADEALSFTISKLESIYSRGASWNGNRPESKTALVISAIILVLVISRYNESDNT
ncbi:MAG: hypothetical protein H7281_07140 [Bacteriovorax sp.]|nr:hypothetical protein [Bacteriovorax sp.]